MGLRIATVAALVLAMFSFERPAGAEPITYPISPFGIVVVSVPEGARDAFFDRLARYAGETGFSFEVTRFSPVRPSFRVYLARSDIRVMGTNVESHDRFELAFLQYFGHERLPDEVTAKVVTLLREALANGDGWQITETN